MTPHFRRAACNWLGISREAHYQVQQWQMQQAAKEQLIIELVQENNVNHPLFERSVEEVV